MQGDDRLADKLRSAAPTADPDAVFARVWARKVRRHRVRAARVPAALAVSAAVIAGVVALSSPGDPARLAADGPRARSESAQDASSGRPAAPSGDAPVANAPARAVPGRSDEARGADAPRAEASRELPPTPAPDPGAVYAGVARGDEPRSVNAVDFADPQHGWAVDGSDGGIYATADGGETWARQATSYAGTFRALDFVDAAQGWALTPSSVIHTADGGQSWTEQTTPADSRASNLPKENDVYNDVVFVDARRGWIVGNCGVVVATEDGGETWATQVLPDCTRPGLRRVFFADSERGWAVPSTEGPLLATTDGGETWTTQSLADPGLTDIYFADALNGWAVGAGGAVLATSDGGATWSRRRTPRKADFTGIFFGDRLHGWAVGGDGADAGVVLATRDGGVTWTEQTISARPLLGGLAFTPTLAWVYGPDGLRHTTDGGKTWSAT